MNLHTEALAHAAINADIDAGLIYEPPGQSPEHREHTVNVAGPAEGANQELELVQTRNQRIQTQDRRVATRKETGGRKKKLARRVTTKGRTKTAPLQHRRGRTKQREKVC